ncbi:MAG TPA: hypothetical protein PLP14_08445 [Chitinophagaceae bacterium]|nr:hypothetical protein [Chitinophagaceae bacterium]
MKQIFLLLAFFLSLNSTLLAQKDQELPAQVQKELNILKKADLNLSEIQLSRIAMVLKSYDDMTQKTLKTLDGNKSVIETRLKEIRQNKINNIKGAFTPQQVEKFDALKLESKF